MCRSTSSTPRTSPCRASCCVRSPSTRVFPIPHGRTSRPATAWSSRGCGSATSPRRWSTTTTRPTSSASAPARRRPATRRWCSTAGIRSWGLFSASGPRARRRCRRPAASAGGKRWSAPCRIFRSGFRAFGRRSSGTITSAASSGGGGTGRGATRTRRKESFHEWEASQRQGELRRGRSAHPAARGDRDGGRRGPVAQQHHAPRRLRRLGQPLLAVFAVDFARLQLVVGRFGARFRQPSRRLLRRTYHPRHPVLRLSLRRAALLPPSPSLRLLLTLLLALLLPVSLRLLWPLGLVGLALLHALRRLLVDDRSRARLPQFDLRREGRSRPRREAGEGGGLSRRPVHRPRRRFRRLPDLP